MIATLVVLAATLLGSPAPDPAVGEAIPAYEGVPQRQVTATAYTSGPESTGKRPGHPQYGLTFTGTRATEGKTIAVDPDRIPLGSRVYIYELEQTLIAEDTGGSIRGDHIDIYMEDLSQALEWGVRKVGIDVQPKL